MTASECRAFLLTAFLALLSTEASGQFVRGEKACRETRGQEKVRACSDALDNPGLSRIKRAILLSLRADAYPASNEGCAAAAEDLTQALDLWPNRDFNYLQLLTNRSSVYLKCDPLDPRALADADRKVALAPGWVTYQQRGIVYFNRAEYGKAIQDFRKSLSFKVDSNTLANLGDTLNRTQQYADAIPLLTKAISIRPYPNVHKAYASRSEAWRLRGDLDAALQDANAAIKAAPSNALAHVTRGDTLRFRGELDAAIADYNTALANEPNYSPALLNRGLAYEKMGDLQKARADFQDAVLKLDSLGASDVSGRAKETARARLAAYDSGAPQPVILPAPIKVTTETSVPTPAIVAPILTTPLAPANAQATIKQGRRVALVIGNAAYQKAGELRNPRRDAAAVASSLRNLGFEVVTVTIDEPREKVIARLRAFSADADQADWAMVYYSGHGIEVNGQNYIIPVDATLKTDRDVQFEAVPVDQIMASIDGARKLKLIILDACRNNPFAAKIQKTGTRDTVAMDTEGGSIGTRSIGRGLGEVKVKGASLVVFAAKHGQTALDGEGENSPFTIALVQRIATPGVEINKIFRLVRDDVMEATAGRQEPYTYGSLPGREDFFFAAK